MTTTDAKAWLYTNTGYPSCLTQQTTKVASTPPSPKHMIIKTKAAALNPVDIQLMNLPIWGLPLPMSPFNHPKEIGEDFAGEVIATGAESGFKVGDEVFGICMPGSGSSGSLQEFMLINTEKAPVLRKPSGWSIEQAAAIPLVYLTARTCIESITTHASQGSKVVVIGGSSSTGMYVVHLAKQMGCRVLATCSARNADFVKSMGAEVVIDYNTQSVPEQVKRWGPKAIVDCIGGTDCLSLAPRYVTIVGDKTSRLSMGGSATYMWQPQMWLRWFVGRIGLSVAYDCVNLELKKPWLEEATRLPASKVVIDSTYTFDKVKEALERLNTGRARGKVVVTFP